MATCERKRIDLSEQPFAAICATPIGWLLVESSEGRGILPQLDSSVRYLGSLYSSLTPRRVASCHVIIIIIKKTDRKKRVVVVFHTGFLVGYFF
jgi:hypothetical protein